MLLARLAKIGGGGLCFVRVFLFVIVVVLKLLHEDINGPCSAALVSQQMPFLPDVRNYGTAALCSLHQLGSANSRTTEGKKEAMSELQHAFG